MNIERCYDIRHENGAVLIPDFECKVDACLEWENGEPVVVIDDILVRDWNSKNSFTSLIFERDPLFNTLAARLEEIIDADESILELLMEADGVHYHGGANNPDGYYVEAAQ